MTLALKQKILNVLARFCSPYHRAMPYRDYLKQLHDVIIPESYFEIGVDEGRTLALARCPAIGIDPSLTRLKRNNNLSGSSLWRRRNTRIAPQLFEMTSDQFFATHNLSQFFPGGIDLAFLDGMHLFEFILRDFLNTERFARCDSIIALHDCYPANAEMTEREHRPEARTDHTTKSLWTGDVWKILPVLQEYRPDLRVFVLDCPPTGLVIITGLDPSSTTLLANYETIVERFAKLSLEDYGLLRFRSEFPPLDSSLCPPSALIRQNGRIEEARISGSS